jgi:hypothetical protein
MIAQTITKVRPTVSIVARFEKDDGTGLKDGT